MSWKDNIVCNPEDYGLEFVDTLELDDEPYQFWTLAVLKDEQGYYLATDSGCSCPSPFESHMSRDDLTGPLTAEQAREEVSSLIAQGRGVTSAEGAGLLAQIR